jgi:hypothetical protein
MSTTERAFADGKHIGELHKIVKDQDPVLHANPVGNNTATSPKAQLIELPDSLPKRTAPEGPNYSSPGLDEKAQVAEKGVAAALNALNSSPKISSLGDDIQTSEEVRSWFSSCTATFFKQVHYRWPVLHAPVFDEKLDDLVVSVTVVLMGAWLDKGTTPRVFIEAAYDHVLDNLFEKMVSVTPNSIRHVVEN